MRRVYGVVRFQGAYIPDRLVLVLSVIVYEDYDQILTVSANEKNSKDCEVASCRSRIAAAGC